MTAEEEENLAAFLKKVQKACADDKNGVPDFVGLQVDQWMKELEDKKNVESKSAQDVQEKKEGLDEEGIAKGDIKDSGQDQVKE